MNYDCLLDLLPPLAVIWVGTAVDKTDGATSIVDAPSSMGTALGVLCCHTVVVVPFGVLGAADVL